ncbi:PAM domain (PCI/PINT associated module) protein [Actinidia rufa]|uniref:PAM domain (PCI/PINT associated module) protein n=1 Tax=Actinidia rufa TaxID=165716 RepID=A0A7J0ETQ4_9ERIC|nr:PAM domain (PCI/PINT associated module) protein [Actinidia rufa]
MAKLLFSSFAFALLSISEDEHDMEVDTATSATQAPMKHSLPELEIYCYLLVLIFLIDQKRYNEAKACSSASIARLKNLNRRTIDVLAAKLYFYYSLSYELTGDLAEIRGNLLALHRIATLRHDELGQETLLNLLLRNYLHYNLYDQAEKLRSKAPRFEAHSNQQAIPIIFCLHLPIIRMECGSVLKGYYVALLRRQMSDL